MAPKLEFEGKSVDAAVEKACNELNLGKEQLKYDVLSYGATGIFGIVGAKKARIRVKGPRGRKAPASAVEKKAPPAAEKAASADPPGDAAEAAEEQEAQPPLPEQIPAPSPERTDTAGPTDAATDSRDPEEARVGLADLEAAASAGKKLLERILTAISEETRIVVELEGSRIHFDVKGGNPAVLIGKRGQTLEAIQYLVDKAANQQRKNRIRVVVDVEGYWRNRRASLQEMAKRMADKSKQTGKPITLGQMNAQDRRIIHLTLKEDTAVRTQSRGEGVYRKLVIFPRKNSPRKAKPYSG